MQNPNINTHAGNWIIAELSELQNGDTFKMVLFEPSYIVLEVGKIMCTCRNTYTLQTESFSKTKKVFFFKPI